MRSAGVYFAYIYMNNTTGCLLQGLVLGCLAVQGGPLGKTTHDLLAGRRRSHLAFCRLG